jgi:hypothetical protein
MKATYRLFVENATPTQKLIHAKTEDNPYLPKQYVELLREQYDPRMLQAYLEGKFVNLTSGQVYHAFERDKHISQNEIIIDKNRPIALCFDFNVYPMSVCWGQYGSRNDISIIGEYVCRTYSHVDAVCNELRSILPRDIDVIIYGDCSGKYGSANSNLTSYEIIHNNLAGFFKSLRYNIPSKNPAVRDRVNVVNSRLSHDGCIKINASCKRLLADLEQVVWDSRGQDMDKSNIELTHISDALGYFLAYEFPILERSFNTVTRNL